MEMKETFIPAINDGIHVRKEDFGLLIVSKRTPILTMNHDSELIWNCINGSNTIEDIFNNLLSKANSNYDINKNVIKEFIISCYKLGLVDIVNKE